MFWKENQHTNEKQKTTYYSDFLKKCHFEIIANIQVSSRKQNPYIRDIHPILRNIQLITFVLIS
jgi:hypothetical protein